MDMSDESGIHKLVEDSLQKHEIEYIHEAMLGKGRRVDFLIGRTAVEIKKGAPSSLQVARQLKGHLESEAVDEIVAVTRKRVTLPKMLLGKRVYAISLDRLWGVTLP